VSWGGAAADVLSVKQSLTPRDGAQVLATFGDRSPALVSGATGKGRVYCAGFLPGLAYIKPALDARHVLEERRKSEPQSLSLDEAAALERSANPWAYPADVRQLLLTPVRESGAVLPLRCDAALVDAVYMTHEKGVLIPLANYTNRPIERLRLNVTVPRRIRRVESVVRGAIPFDQSTPQTVTFSLPLDNNDFVKLYFE
jgi:hypothetical protein